MIEPLWMPIARSLIGTKENRGRPSNEVIIKWAKQLGGFIAEYYQDDAIPWCGLFVTYVMHRAGYRVNQRGLRAMSWLEWGKTRKPLERGAIMVFSRDGGAHVTFLERVDLLKGGYWCLGGNQHNEVNISFYPKKHFLGSRWPDDKDLMVKSS